MSNSFWLQVYKYCKWFLYLFALLVSIKTLKEPDTFWQLATGRWILQNLSVPHTDTFSYTFFGQPWINIKWGYEVCIALIEKALSTDMIFLFQAIVLCLITWIVLRLVKSISLIASDDIIYSFVALLISLLLIANCSYRFIGRPEIVSYLFAIAYVYIIHQSNSHYKKLYWLPALQIIWTNMHEAFGLGIIIIGIYALSKTVVYLFFNNQKKYPFPLWYLLAWLLSIAAIAVNPYGWKMYAQVWEIMRQLKANIYTSELADYTAYSYWQWNTYVLLITVIVTVVAYLFVWFRQKKLQRKNAIELLYSGHALLLLAFAYLAKDAYRNLVLLNLAIIPFCADAVIKALKILIANRSAKLALHFVAFLYVAMAAGIYSAIVTNKLYKGTNHQYGLGVSTVMNPVDAAQFLKHTGLDKQTLFTDYLSSSYLLYALLPHYKTFIDLRDLDVFADTFFDKHAEMLQVYSTYQIMDKQYGFKGAVVLNNQFGKLQMSLMQDSNYLLVYFDPLISVFAKKELGFPPALHISKFSNNSLSKTASFINKLFYPLYQPALPKTDKEYQEAEWSYFANCGDVVSSLNRMPAAPDENSFTDMLIRGKFYLQKFSSDSVKNNLWLDSSDYFMQKACKLNGNSFEPFFYTGIVAFYRGYLKKAAELFEKSCALQNDFTNAHLYAAEVYKTLHEQSSRKPDLLRLVHHLEILNAQTPGNPNVIWNLGIAYYKQGNCSDAVSLLYESLKYDRMLPAEDIALAKQYIDECNNK